MWIVGKLDRSMRGISKLRAILDAIHKCDFKVFKSRDLLAYRRTGLKPGSAETLERLQMGSIVKERVMLRQISARHKFILTAESRAAIFW